MYSLLIWCNFAIVVDATSYLFIRSEWSPPNAKCFQTSPSDFLYNIITSKHLSYSNGCPSNWIPMLKPTSNAITSEVHYRRAYTRHFTRLPKLVSIPRTQTLPCLRSSPIQSNRSGYLLLMAIEFELPIRVPKDISLYRSINVPALLSLTIGFQSLSIIAQMGYTVGIVWTSNLHWEKICVLIMMLFVNPYCSVIL